MYCWLLLVDGVSGIARGVTGIEVADGPDELETNRLEVGRVTVNGERGALALSAKQGAEVALRLLFRELRRRRSIGHLAITTAPLEAAVTGRSGELLFGLAVFTHLARRDGLSAIAEPRFAATGTLDPLGNVGSVEAVVAKLEAALASELPAGGLIFYPRTDEGQIDGALRRRCRARGLQLRPVDRIDEALAALGIEIKGGWTGTPFRSLNPYNFQDSRIFFGRQGEVAARRERLHQRATAGRPGMLVIGASGAGKSSFCMAGLLPALKLDVPDLEHAVLRPREAISGQAGTEVGEADLARSVLASWRRRDENQTGFDLAAAAADCDDLKSLADLYPETVSPTDRFVWVVDQFEELFTLGFAAEARIAFAHFLRDLQARGVWVVGTLRSEFYGQYLDLRDEDGGALLTQVFGRNGVFDLPRMGRDSLRQVIVGPAELAGLHFGTRTSDGIRLDDALLADAMGTDDALPLLGFALQTLYDGLERAEPDADPAAEQPRLLTFAAYESLGGLRGAIGRIVEPMFGSLDAEGRAALPSLLSALAVPSGDGQRETARPAALDQWPVASPGRKLIDALVAIRVLVSEQAVAPDAPAQVRVAHEALFTHWEEAVSLLKESHEVRLTAQRLRIRAEQWAAERCPTFRLLRDKEIVDGQRVLERWPTGHSDPLLSEFVHASIADDERLRTLSAERAEALKQAGDSALRSQSRTVAILAKQVLDQGDAMTAVLALLEVLPSSGLERPWSPEAAAILREAILVNREHAVTNQRLPHNGGFTSGGNAVITVGGDNHLYRWQIGRERTPAVCLGGKGSPAYAVVSKDGSLCVCPQGTESINLWKISDSPPEYLQLPRAAQGLSCLAFSPDCRLVVEASRRSMLWSLDGVVPEGAILPGEDRGAFHANFSRDSSRLALGFWDGSAQVWNLAKSPPKAEVVKGHSDCVFFVALNHDGSRLVTLSTDDTARLWRWDDDGKRFGGLLGEHTGRVMHADFSPDGRFLATGSSDSSVRIWDVDRLSKSIVVLNFHRGRITKVRFNGDGSRLLTLSHDHTACVWDFSDGKAELFMCAPHAEWVTEGDFSPDGEWLVTCCPVEKAARLWNLGRLPQDPQIFARDWGGAPTPKYNILDGTSRAVTCAEFSPDGSRLVAIYADGAILHWDLNHPGRTCTDLGGADEQLAQGQRVAFSPDGKWLAGGGRAFRLWKIEGPVPTPIDLHGFTNINTFAFSPESQCLWTSLSPFATKEGKVVKWDLRANPPEPEIDLDQQGIWFRAAFSPNGEHLVTLDISSIASLWNVKFPGPLKRSGATRLKQAATHLSGSGKLKEAVFSPDGSCLAIATELGPVELWNMADLSAAPHQFIYESYACSIAFSADGRKIFVANGDGSVRIWEIRNLSQPPMVLQVHDLNIHFMSMKLSPGGKYLATASSDRTVRLWNLQAPRPVPAILCEGRQQVNYLSFNPLSDKLLAAFDDGSIRIWTVLSDDELIILAEASVTRTLTDAQREFFGFEPNGDADRNAILPTRNIQLPFVTS